MNLIELNKRRFLTISITACLFFLTACSDNPAEPEVQSDDKFVGGVNVTQLFEPPTDSEINAIRAEWQARSTPVENFEVVQTQSETFGNTPATVRVVSHTIDGVKHYGLIAVPNGAAPGSLPVVIYTHGGDNGLSANELTLILQLFPALAGEFVVVAPSYRDEPLRTDAATYRSDGPASPWDRDVDDTLALLNAALENTPEANGESIGAIGLSRGAAVALLAAIRDPRIELVVEYFGPTDFFGEFVMDLTEDALEGIVSQLPGADFAQEHIVDPLKNGEISMEQARLELLRRSPVYFAESLPQVQVHHGMSDTIVPVGEAERIIAVMEGLGRTAPEFESYLYANVGHLPAVTSLPRTEAFLRRLLSPDAQKIAQRK